MITFKQYLREIDYDDEVYKKDDSDKVASSPIDDSWQPLMKVDGYEAVWKQFAGTWKIALKNKSESFMVLEVKEKTVKVPSGKLTGVVTNSLSAKHEARGKGLAVKLYNALIEHGQVLFSSNSQTTGSRKLWEQLVDMHTPSTFVLAEEAAARWYINKDKEYKHRDALYVLLTGPMDKLNDEAYASAETRWVIVPGAVDTLKKEAIHL